MDDSSGGWRCKECSRTFSQRVKLLYHVEIHVSGLYYPCNDCSKSFNTRSRLGQHRFDDHSDKARKYKKDRKEESNTKNEGVPIIPLYVDREISEKIQDLVEQKSNTEWRCTKCSMTKTKMSYLVTHLETHLSYNHPCPQCDFTSRTRQALRFHYSVNHKKAI